MRPSLRESTRPPLGATTGGVGTAPTDAPAPVVSPPSATQETGTTPPVAERPPAEISVSEPIVPAPAVETPVGEVITQPERIGTLNPVYPQIARAAQIQGDVLLEAVILPDGRVTRVTVLKSPNRVLNNAAIRAVEQSTYKPGLRNGVPDTFTVQITVRFALP